VVSVGASGALFGVFGGFLAVTLRRRDQLPAEFVSSVRKNALWLIGINLVIGLSVAGIDLAAHVGGFLAGFGIAFLLAVLVEGPVPTEAERRRRHVRAVLIVTSITAALLVGTGYLATYLTMPA
jgi:rhomboid protease GluP